MLRHVVLLTWASGTPPEAVEAVETRAAAALPDRIPEIRAYSVGRDAGVAEGNAHLAVVADFDDVEGWRVYRDDPEHQRVIAELIRPYLADRSAAQFHV